MLGCGRRRHYPPRQDDCGEHDRNCQWELNHDHYHACARRRPRLRAGSDVGILDLLPRRQEPSVLSPAVPGAGKTVALTFDDGPGPSTPPSSASSLSYGVRATFFNVGKQEAAWPQEVRAEARAGFLVGNHTWNHRDLVKLSRSKQVAELDKVIAEQEALTGTSPCEFRPPDGDYDATTLSLARASAT